MHARTHRVEPHNLTGPAITSACWSPKRTERHFNCSFDPGPAPYITVVCGKTVNGVQVVPECFHIFSGAQHRPYLTSAFPNASQVLLTQEEMVRCHLTCHLNALLLCCLDDQYLRRKTKMESHINTCCSSVPTMYTHRITLCYVLISLKSSLMSDWICVRREVPVLWLVDISSPAMLSLLVVFCLIKRFIVLQSHPHSSPTI